VFYFRTQWRKKGGKKTTQPFFTVGPLRVQHFVRQQLNFFQARQQRRPKHWRADPRRSFRRALTSKDRRKKVWSYFQKIFKFRKLCSRPRWNVTLTDYLPWSRDTSPVGCWRLRKYRGSLGVNHLNTLPLTLRRYKLVGHFFGQVLYLGARVNLARVYYLIFCHFFRAALLFCQLKEIFLSVANADKVIT
jgi:hypothetical protein